MGIVKPIKPKKPKMNLLEARYARQLEALKAVGEILDWRFEEIRFKLGGNKETKEAWFKPDFLVVYPDRFEIHEVKGHWREAARVRIKVASQLYPWLAWKAVLYNRRDGWCYEKFN